MNVPAKCKELGIEKIIFGPAALMAQGVPVEVKLSYNVLQERTAYVLNAIAVHDDLLAALKSARLMLYAWKGSRPAEHGPHPELDQVIDRAEKVLAKARGGE